MSKLQVPFCFPFRNFWLVKHNLMAPDYPTLMYNLHIFNIWLKTVSFTKDWPSTLNVRGFTHKKIFVGNFRIAISSLPSYRILLSFLLPDLEAETLNPAAFVLSYYWLLLMRRSSEYCSQVTMVVVLNIMILNQKKSDKIHQKKRGKSREFFWAAHSSE